MSAAFSTKDWLTASTADPEIDARQVDALAGAQLPPDQHLALHVISGDAFDFELNKAVVEIQGIAGFYGLRQAVKRHRDPFLIADDVLRGQGKGFAGLQLDRLLIQLANTHLGARQIRHDRQAALGCLSRGPQLGNHLPMALEITVGKIEACHIHTRPDHLLHDFRRFGCRSDRSHYLGLIRW
jgi:hypothetical protein